MPQEFDHISEHDLFTLLQAAGLTAREKLEELSEEEAAQLADWLKQDTKHAGWHAQLSSPGHFSELLAQYQAIRQTESLELEKFRKAHLLPSNTLVANTVHRVHFLRTTWFRYAAALLLIAGTAAYLYTSHHHSQKQITEEVFVVKPDILPGGNKAVLTLSDGSTIALDSAGLGSLATQGATRIIKMDTGLLAYHGEAGNGTMLYNTISTPKGGQYQIVLADGTRVWLNAASSIRFPTTFSGERRVSVTGEVYFEVGPDKKLPFYVNVNESEVQVLGTAFNINAYTDEGAIRTTLIEGSVKISIKNSQNSTGHEGKDVLLKPGQQAAFIDHLSVVEHPNIEQVVAWKNGLFNFEDASLEQVMRQLARWYDLEVVYEKGIPQTYFIGEVVKNVTLNDALAFLGKTGVHFRLEGRKLIVLP